VVLPVHQLAVANSSRLYVGSRQGQLIALDLEREGDSFRSRAHPLYQATEDLHTISVSADGKLVAVGHLAPGLALLQADGRLLWRRHPEDGTATEGQVWVVSLDAEGRTLYAGSGGPGTNRLAALDPRTGAARAHCYVEARLTGLATLPGGQGVATILSENFYTCRLAVYDPDLAGPLWERTFDEPITALAADRQQPLLVASIGYEGQVSLLDVPGNRVLATEPARSVVNGLAIAQGRTVAAAMQDGTLVLMRYLPKEFRL
jgi:hypothetical protein